VFICSSVSIRTPLRYLRQHKHNIIEKFTKNPLEQKHIEHPENSPSDNLLKSVIVKLHPCHALRNCHQNPKYSFSPAVAFFYAEEGESGHDDHVRARHAVTALTGKIWPWTLIEGEVLLKMGLQSLSARMYPEASIAATLKSPKFLLSRASMR